MIVDPDFLDHWRTTMLVDALGRDPLAPLYVIRIWAHCQTRKAWEFANLPAAGLKALCRAAGQDADALEAAMIASGFVERHGSDIHVPGWAEHNASLIAAWSNGRSGGRPTKQQKNNPVKTHGLPMGNPAVTHGQPMANPSLTHGEPIREEEIREEKKDPPVAIAPAPPKGDDPPPAAPALEPEPPEVPAAPSRKTRAKAAARVASDFERPDDIPPGVWAEFLAYRLEMAKGHGKAPFTVAAMKGVIKDIRKCYETNGEKPEDALYRCMARGWRTPYPERDMPPRGGSIGSNGSTGETNYQRTMREKMEQFAPGIAAKKPGTQSRFINEAEVTDVTPRRLDE